MYKSNNDKGYLIAWGQEDEKNIACMVDIMPFNTDFEFRGFTTSEKIIGPNCYIAIWCLLNVEKFISRAEFESKFNVRIEYP